MSVYAGRLCKFYVDLNGVGGGSANWTVIAQQRGGGVSRTTETADATHKDDNGWPSAVITRTPWGYSIDGALDPADPAWAYLKASWKAKTKPWCQYDESAISGEKIEGTMIIMDLSSECPEGDLVAYTLELQGDGAMVDSP